MLPFWAVLGHNILYITIGFVWLRFADDGAAETVTFRQGQGGYGYQIAALACFAVFADNVLRRMEVMAPRNSVHKRTGCSVSDEFFDRTG